MYFDYELFGKMAYDRRISAGLGLREVASETGVSVSTISRIENSKGLDITMSNFTLLCNWLECDPGLFFGTGRWMVRLERIEERLEEYARELEATR